MSENPLKGSFLNTTSGCITIFAGLATVIGALVSALYPLGLLPFGPSTPTPVAQIATGTATLVPTQVSATPAVSPSPTLAAPTPTATLPAPPGVYASAIRIDPAAPRRGEFVTFYVSFLNTTNTPQHVRWVIKIFEPGKRNSFGDTAPIEYDIALGTSELPSAANWRITGGGDCVQFFAHAYFIDQDRNLIEFVKPDKSGNPVGGFQVCP